MERWFALKLNIGCGSRVLKGWFNVDVAKHPNAPHAPQLLCDITQGIPLDNSCADELMAIHVFEHFYRWQVEGILREWARLLKSGGRIILELPDLLKCCQNVLDNVPRGGKHDDQLGRWGLYGDPRLEDIYMCHRWGYTPDEVMQLLRNAGFQDVRHLATEFHPAGKKHRDMRIEGIKK